MHWLLALKLSDTVVAALITGVAAAAAASAAAMAARSVALKQIEILRRQIDQKDFELRFQAFDRRFVIFDQVRLNLRSAGAEICASVDQSISAGEAWGELERRRREFAALFSPHAADSLKRASDFLSLLATTRARVNSLSLTEPDSKSYSMSFESFVDAQRDFSELVAGFEHAALQDLRLPTSR